MVNKLDFFTPLSFQSPHSSLERAAETLDDYCYLGGRKAYVIENPSDHSRKIEIAAGKASNIFLSAVKVASYFTVIIPLIMLALKAIVRSQLKLPPLSKQEDHPQLQLITSTPKDEPEKNLPPYLALPSPIASRPSLFSAEEKAMASLSERVLIDFFDRLDKSFTQDFGDVEGVPFREKLVAIRVYLEARAPTVGFLDLSERDLTRLPPEIGLFTNIQLLILKKNQLIELPEELGQLVHLTHIQVQENQLTRLPSSIGALQSLTYLDVSDNLLEELPPELFSLENVTHLSLAYNKFSSLPEELSHLRKLESLNLNDNHVTSLPHSFGKLKNLKTFYYANNRVESFPESLLSCDSLTTLGLNQNRLQEIPDVSSLGHLENLLLKDNLLKALPEGTYPALRFLIIRNNPIESLPESLSRCFTLEELDVRNTNIREFQGWQRLPGDLQIVYISGNNLSLINDLKRLRTRRGVGAGS